jgi:hypothetical protein
MWPPSRGQVNQWVRRKPGYDTMLVPASLLLGV